MATSNFDPASLVYQIKIALVGIEPPVWRRVEIEDCALDTLHGVIQDAMGWGDYHMYEFQFDDTIYTNPHAADDERHSAAKMTVGQLAGQNHTTIDYVYDKGNDWKHQIEIEAIQSPEDQVHYPRCVEGQRACPPEDCGGPEKYQKILSVLKDPDHDEYDDYYDLLEENFDPEKFDVERINRMWATWDFKDPESSPTYEETTPEPELVEEQRRSKNKAKAAELKPNSPSHIARNDPCPCGSGKKYKKCCMKRDKDDYDDE